MAGIIVAYGFTLALLAILHRGVAPESGNLTIIDEVTGGVVAIGCGVMAGRGHSRRVWIIATVAVLAFLLMAQTVGSWGESAEKKNLNEALVHTVMFAITVGMLKYTVHGERPPGYFSPGAQHGKPLPK